MHYDRANFMAFPSPVGIPIVLVNVSIIAALTPDNFLTMRDAYYKILDENKSLFGNEILMLSYYMHSSAVKEGNAIVNRVELADLDPYYLCETIKKSKKTSIKNKAIQIFYRNLDASFNRTYQAINKKGQLEIEFELNVRGFRDKVSDPALIQEIEKWQAQRGI